MGSCLKWVIQKSEGIHTGSRPRRHANSGQKHGHTCRPCSQQALFAGLMGPEPFQTAGFSQACYWDMITLGSLQGLGGSRGLARPTAVKSHNVSESQYWIATVHFEFKHTLWVFFFLSSRSGLVVARTSKRAAFEMHSKKLRECWVQNKTAEGKKRLIHVGK